MSGEGTFLPMSFIFCACGWGRVLLNFLGRERCDFVLKKMPVDTLLGETARWPMLGNGDLLELGSPRISALLLLSHQIGTFHINQ